MAFISLSMLPEKVQVELEKANLLAVKRILWLSNSEIRKLCNLTDSDIKLVKLHASRMYHQRSFIRASEINSAEEDRRITLDCQALDTLLAGGIRVRGITELAGESGAGKTQICLQAALTVQYPEEYGGLNKGAVYICTEDKFPSSRLSQLLKHFPRNDLARKALTQVNLGDRIYVDHIADFDSLRECIFRRLPKLLQSSEIGLIVIDSIAAIFRADYALKDSVKRAADIRQIGLQLHHINRKYKIAILCVNQVTDIVDSSIEKVPALGLAWANILTTRLQAYKHHNKRILQVTSSPDMPSNRCFYHIASSGIHGFISAS